MRDITILFARLRRLSLDTGYGLTQARLALETQTDWHAMSDFDRDATAAGSMKGIETPYALILTDALAIAGPGCSDKLREALGNASDEIDFAVPMTSVSEQPEQLGEVPGGAMTLYQFEQRAATIPKAEPRVVEWGKVDPGLYLARASALQNSDAELTHALSGKKVLLVPGAFLYRYGSQRSFAREDILKMVPENVDPVLEIGCGEGLLGEAIKKARNARVSGVEIDEYAAAKAQKRLDEVYVSDVREVVRKIKQKFRFIVGGDILEHLEDPWEFLRELKRVVEPGGQLLLSIPNIAFWPVVADLLEGRFDYIYAGPVCVGHLRFYSKKTIEDTLNFAHWKVEQIEPHAPFDPEGYAEFEKKLDLSGLPYSREDLQTPGWYVLARHG